MRQSANLIVGLLTCLVLWITLSGLLGTFIVFDVGSHMQSRWQVNLFILYDTPLLSICALSGILIFRARPLLFGVTCAIAATASVVLCTTNPVLLEPVFVAKWALLFVFAIAGAYLGWWILRLRQRQNVMLKVWQSLVALAIVFGIMSLVSFMQTIVIRRKIFKPLVQVLQTLDEEDIRELFECNVQSNATPSATSDIR